MRLGASRRRVGLLLVISVGALGSAFAGEATPPPRAEERPAFPARAERVTVDVVVLDERAQPVAGLRPDDFLVKEDGAPQTIVDFEAIDVPLATSREPRPIRSRVSSNSDGLRESARAFVIVFDGLNLSAAGASAAKSAVKTFLGEAAGEGDLVCLAATQAPTWWTARIPQGREALLALLDRQAGMREAAHFIPEWMSDYEALRIAQHGDPEVAARVWRRWMNARVVGLRAQAPTSGSLDPLILSRAHGVYGQARQRAQGTLEVVRRALASMSEVKGRKALILLSEGFVHDPGLIEYAQVAEASRRSNTALYFADAAGLSGGPDFFSALSGGSVLDRDVGAQLTEPSSADGATALASASGGFSIRNTNALGAGMARIAQESQRYYLIGYQPTNDRRDGSYRRISVEVDRRDVKVRARRGYWAPAAEPLEKTSAQGSAVAQAGLGGTARRDAQGEAFQRALDSPYDRADLPLRMTTIVGEETEPRKARVFLVADVSLRGLDFRPEGERSVNALQMLLIVVNRETGEHTKYDERIDLRLRPETRDAFLDAGYTIARDFALAPGHYQARLLVGEANEGRLGSLTHDFTVPELDRFRLSSVILTDRFERSQEGTPMPGLIARRTFAPRSVLAVVYEAYRAAPDPARHVPRVSSGYRLLAGDGTVVRDWPAAEIAPRDGRLTRVTELPLGDTAPGRYELVIRLKDEVTGQTLETREPLEVVAAAE